MCNMYTPEEIKHLCDSYESELSKLRVESEAKTVAIFILLVAFVSLVIVVLP